jgi:hypothetical protein
MILNYEDFKTKDGQGMEVSKTSCNSCCRFYTVRGDADSYPA